MDDPSPDVFSLSLILKQTPTLSYPHVFLAISSTKTATHLLNLFLNLTYYTYCLYSFFSIHHRILAVIFMSPSEPLTLSFALQFISKTCTQKILSIRYVIKV